MFQGMKHSWYILNVSAKLLIIVGIKKKARKNFVGFLYFLMG